MKLSILAKELKDFSRCIISLAKVGDDIYFEWDGNELSLRTVNNSRSAFGRFQFKSLFFEKIVDGKSLKFNFKLTVKSCMTVFRSSNINKNVDRCKMIFDDQRCNLIVQLFCQKGISKTYNLNFVDCESLQAKYSITDSKNILKISTKVCLDILNNFQQNQEELILTVNADSCVWSTYIDNSEVSKQIFTKMSLNLEEFEEYDISNSIEVIMCFKELRAAVSFGEHSNYRLHMSYSDPGRPFIISYSESLFKAHFVLATLGSSNNLSNTSLQTRLQKSRSNITPSFLDFDECEELDNILLTSSAQVEETYMLQSQSVRNPIEKSQILENNQKKRTGARLFASFLNPRTETSSKTRKLSEELDGQSEVETVLVEDSD